MDLQTCLEEKKIEREKIQTRLAQIKEKIKVVEERLPKQLEFARKEAVRKYLGSEGCSDKFSDVSTFVMLNGFKIGIDQVRELQNDDDELIAVLEKLQINPDVSSGDVA
ncbi:hypothetical protein Dimus_031918 [Dionaea muscipula]